MSSPASANGHRNALWDTLLDAEYNLRYWTLITDRYAMFDRCLKALIAVASSGSAIAAWNVWTQHPHVWQALASTACFAAWLHPYICDSERMRKMSELVATWKEIQINYELLWEFDSGLAKVESLRNYEAMKHREAKLDETKLPKSKRLAKLAFDEVWRLRGTHVR